MTLLLALFAKGLAIGLSVAVPVGPIGLLCIRTTLHRGQWHGFLTGLGASAADFLYGLLAAFGISSLQQALLRHGTLMRVGGAIFLLLLGLRMLLKRVAGNVEVSSGAGAGAFAAAFLLTVSNPFALLIFLGVFAAIAPAHTSLDMASALTLTAGVAAGSALWWLVLSAVVAVARSRFNPVWVTRISRGAALVIVAFGLAVLAELLL